MNLDILIFPDVETPEGKCVVQAFGGGDFDYWKDLRKDRPSYDAEKKRIAVEMQSRLDDLFPGFGSKVEVVDVATPARLTATLATGKDQ